MASGPVTELCIMKMKPDATVEAAGTPAHGVWQELVAVLKSTPGMTSVRFGRVLEDPGMAIGCIAWDSLASYRTYTAAAASGQGGGILDKLASLADGATAYHVPFSPDAAATFGAPCTELATGYGAEPEYLAQVREFAEAMNRGGVAGSMPGFVAACSGETVQDDVAKEPGAAAAGKAVVLAIGWESKEAHLEAKGKPGAIADNIHLLRSARREMGLVHVNFKER